jgi:hypothetical protein
MLLTFLIVFMFSIYFLSSDYCWCIGISCESPVQNSLGVGEQKGMTIT